jgi:methyltransferase (TIGR00027 family)
MKENSQKKASAQNFIAAIVFYLINVLLFPITLLGFVIWVGKIVLTGRRSGLSTTAQGPLAARSTMHNLGEREDEAASRLLPILPGAPWLGMRLASWPMMFAHRVTGYVPKTYRYPVEGEIPPQALASARGTFFDEVVDRFLPGIGQFVILGAGFDTRPYRLPEDTPVRSFEVDALETQAAKRELLEKAGIGVSKVTFVAADFETEDWLRKLVEAGFDPTSPALFLWEGVIIYLDHEAVEDTLRKVASCARGSVIAFDYYTTVSIDSSALYWRFARWATQAAGEPLKFGIDSTPPSRERLAEFLQSCGLFLGEQRTLGEETEGKRAWGGFATAIVE